MLVAQRIISPIGGIQNGTDFHVFYSETEVGPVTKQLYDELVGIQFGDKSARRLDCKSLKRQKENSCSLFFIIFRIFYKNIDFDSI